MLLNNDTEIETFESYREFSENTLLEWKQFLSQIGYHISGNYTPNNTTITATRLEDIGARSAQLDLDYDIPSGITNSEEVKSRLTQYTFNPDFLSFPRDSTGETVLPEGFTLVFTVPDGSTWDSQYAYPAPAIAENNNATWVGPATGKWRFRYDVEESLPDEVEAYFDGLYANTLSLLPWLLPIGLLALLAGFIYNKFVLEKRR
jgi:hypothetical protein